MSLDVKINIFLFDIDLFRHDLTNSNYKRVKTIFKLSNIILKIDFRSENFVKFIHTLTFDYILFCDKKNIYVNILNTITYIQHKFIHTHIK